MSVSVSVSGSGSGSESESESESVCVCVSTMISYFGKMIFNDERQSLHISHTFRMTF